VIDFRYHIVSLTAVFLALAVGVVLGTSALRGPVLNDLNGRVNSLAAENRSLRSDLGSLRDQSAKQDDFAEQVAPALLSGRLAGQSVAVISGPGGGTADRDAVATELTRAGARVVSRVRLSPDFTAPGHSAEIKSLVSQLLPPGVQIPVTTDGAAQAGALLGAVLVGAKSVSVAARSAVLQGFQSLGLLSVDGNPTRAAELALIVASPPATGSQAKLRNASLLGFVTQFDAQAKATVLATDTADGAGSLITAIRADDALTKSLSTVDDLGLSAGRVAATLALAAEAKGRSGQYGMGTGASSRVPPLTS